MSTSQEQLNRLMQLRNSGAISQSDFESLSASVISAGAAEQVPKSAATAPVASAAPTTSAAAPAARSPLSNIGEIAAGIVVGNMALRMFDNAVNPQPVAYEVESTIESHYDASGDLVIEEHDTFQGVDANGNDVGEAWTDDSVTTIEADPSFDGGETLSADGADFSGGDFDGGGMDFDFGF